MRETAKTYFQVAWIISIITGVLYTLTLVGVIIGIPLFIGSSKFKSAINMQDKELVENRKSLLGWGIFLSIVLAPTIIGLIVLLIFVLLVNNHIQNIEDGKTELTEKSLGDTIASFFSSNKTEVSKTKAELEELQKMKDEGLITEEEYNAKRKKILDLD